ncbi:MAG: hypothetical protein U0R69_13385 [Gaiellales bacterium]
MSVEHPIYVFDADILRSFAVVNRLDVLEHRYGRRARITIEVREELAAALQYEPTLGAVLAADSLFPPERSFAVDEIERIRLRLGGRSRDRRHLGEAASIQVALEQGWTFATDDRDATRIARALGVATISTPAILRVCAADGMISSAEAYALVNEMREVHGRGLPSVERSYFDP